jgi:hypothetical protein
MTDRRYRDDPMLARAIGASQENAAKYRRRRASHRRGISEGRVKRTIRRARAGKGGRRWVWLWRFAGPCASLSGFGGRKLMVEA